MWRLERVLRRHGYEVWAWSYRSPRKDIAAHAEDLESRIEARLRATRPQRTAEPQLHFVAHSMGGIVVRAYLRRPGARSGGRTVCMGTPHGGSWMAQRLQQRLLYRLILGSRAAQELAPGSPTLAALGPAPPRLGNIIGATGDPRGRTPFIPGDNDRTVRVSEAHLAGEADAVVIYRDHALLMLDRQGWRHTLHFLKSGRFER
jgi:pimeloyl-ACP methyl ester carboxylesterase